MKLPDTTDSTLALWRKLLANLGGTEATGELRPTIAALLTLLA
jgi:hypothetical protein